MKKFNIQLKHSKALDELARRYVWWDSIDWAYQHPEIFLSSIMNLGSWDDFKILRQEVDQSILIEVLRHAPPGYFQYRSWDYWHVKFGIEPIPDLPKRKL